MEQMEEVQEVDEEQEEEEEREDVVTDLERILWIKRLPLSRHLACTVLSVQGIPSGLHIQVPESASFGIPPRSCSP